MHNHVYLTLHADCSEEAIFVLDTLVSERCFLTQAPSFTTNPHNGDVYGG